MVIQICSFLFFFFFLPDMDSNRKKLSFKWRRTAVTSPRNRQGGDAGSGTPSRWNMSLNEDSNTLPFGDSPGPGGLGALNLDTPKRKAEVLGESRPSLVKLRKLSRKNFEIFTTSKVNLCCKCCSAHLLMVHLKFF